MELKDLNLELISNYLCTHAEKINNKELDTQIIDAIAEVVVNDVTYQIQVSLEPRRNCWADSDKPTIRKNID